MKSSINKLTIFDIWLLFPALLFTLPNTWKFGSLPIAPESILMIFTLYLFTCGDFGVARGQQTFKAIKNIPLSIYMLFVFIMFSLFFAELNNRVLYLFRVLLWFLTFYYAYIFLQKPQNQYKLFLIWTIIAFAGVSILLASPSKWNEKVVDIFAWEHRTTFGYFISIPTIFFLYKTAFTEKWREKFIFSIASLFFMAGVLLTYSRGTWTVVYFGIVAILAYRKKYKLLILFFIVSIAAITLYITAYESQITTTVKSIYNLDIPSSSRYRLDLYHAAFKALPEIGVLGVGPERIGSVLRLYTYDTYKHLEDSGFASDSDIIWLLVAHGPLVLASLLTLVFWWAVNLIKYLRFRKAIHVENIFIISLLIVFIGMILFDNILSSPYGWFLLGAGIGATLRYQQAIQETVLRKNPINPVQRRVNI